MLYLHYHPPKVSPRNIPDREEYARSATVSPAFAQGCAVIPAKVRLHISTLLHSAHTQARRAHYPPQRPAPSYCAHRAPTAEKYRDEVARLLLTPRTVQEFSSR